MSEEKQDRAEVRIPLIPANAEELRKQLEQRDATIEKQKQRIQDLEGQVGEASDFVEVVQTEHDLEVEAQRGELIFKISTDSQGFMRKDKLASLSLDDLQAIRNTFTFENSKDYLAFFERRRAETLTGERKDLSVGEWDSKTKTWKT